MRTKDEIVGNIEYLNREIAAEESVCERLSRSIENSTEQSGKNILRGQMMDTIARMDRHIIRRAALEWVLGRH